MKRITKNRGALAMAYNLDYVEQIVELKELKKGEFFQRIRNGKPSKKVYTKDTWEVGYKKFWCNDYEDISNGILLKSNTPVFVGFTY